MTVATLDALALRDVLASGVDDLARRFFSAAAKGTRVAWNMSVGSDLALPEVCDKPTLTMRWSNFYTGMVLRCAESNPFVAEQFLKVINLVSGPTALLRPAVFLPVTRSLIRRRHRPKVATEPEPLPWASRRADSRTD